MNAHLIDPPQRGYWLNELRLKDFPRLASLAESEERLQAALKREFFTPQRLWALSRLAEEHGDRVELKLNLLMVASFLEHRRSAAIVDVASESLEPSLLASCLSKAGELDRLALAVLMYRQDPALLMAVDLWDRWHSHRRCVFELEGPQRRRQALGEIDWKSLAQGALEDIDIEGIELRAVLPRRSGGEILLGLRQVGPWSNVRTEDGEVVPGRDDDWTLLLLYEGGLSLDTTASDHHRASNVANAVAARLWGEGSRYVPVRRRLRDADLRKLLARLTNPLDDTFRLLEMVAAVPQLPSRPVIAVGNSGQVRIEEAIVEMRESVPYGYEWSDVLSVKVGFMDQYRIAMHFPRPGEEPVLTYSDVDRDKSASLAFESLLAEELGVVVKPKVPIEVRYSRRASRAPQRLTCAHYDDLLQPVIDRPADWMLEALRVLEGDGRLLVRRSCVLRCGDASLGASSGGETLDCPGEVEMPHGAVDPRRPFEQPESMVCECSYCGARWYPGRRPLPLLLRLRIELVHEVIWSWLLERMHSRVSLSQERPGKASGSLRGEPVGLVYLPLARDPADRGLGLAASAPVCWVGRGMPAAYRERGVDLSEVLADGEVPVLQAWRLGRNPALAGRAEPLFAADPASAGPQPERKLRKRTFIVDNRGIWLDALPISDLRATGTRMLLALLWEAARLDDAAKSGRILRGPKRLGELAKIPLRERHIYIWVSRLRDRLEQIAPDEVETLIVSQRGMGYRLGDGVVCVGLDLSEEAAAFLEAKRRGEV